MTHKEWLSLAEYSNQYGVSISTLRRRIRAKVVEQKAVEGKYFLRNLPLDDHHPNYRSTKNSLPVAPPPMKDDGASASFKDFGTDGEEPRHQMKGFLHEPPVQKQQEVHAELFLSELKKAYSLILQEKQEQVLILKNEVADLQTLVRVLEKENETLREEKTKLRIKLKETALANSERSNVPTPNIEKKVDSTREEAAPLKPLEVDFEIERNWFID